MNDLIEFIKAQLDEDERVASGARPEMGDPAAFPDYRTYAVPAIVDEYIELWGPARVMREVEAKRQIIDLCVHTLEYEDHGWSLAEKVLRILALPYVDRPGYREEWRV